MSDLPVISAPKRIAVAVVALIIFTAIALGLTSLSRADISWLNWADWLISAAGSVIFWLGVIFFILVVIQVIRRKYNASQQKKKLD